MMGPEEWSIEIGVLTSFVAVACSAMACPVIGRSIHRFRQDRHRSRGGGRRRVADDCGWHAGDYRLQGADGVATGSGGMTIRLMVVLLAAAGVAAPLRAQVIEIDPAGTAQTYSGPTSFTREGSVPIERRTRAAAAGRRVTPGSIADAARAQGLDPALLQAVAWQESRGRMDAVSAKGARGIMQLMPGTAAELNVDVSDAFDNIRGGATYLRRQLDRFGGSVPLALAAYNAGPGAVLRYGGIPLYRETRNYVATILGRWRALPITNSPSIITIEAAR